IAMNYNELKKYSLALHHLTLAEDFIHTTQILVDKRDVHLQKAIAYSGMKDYWKAYQEQVSVTALNDSIYIQKSENEIADLLLKHESAQKDKFMLEQQQLLQQKDIS